VLSRGLAKKPYERPATAAEFSAALRATCAATDSQLDQALRALNIAAVAEEPVVIPALPTSFERGKRRSKIPLYLGLAGVFMLAVTVGVTLGRRPTEPAGHTSNATGGGGASSASTSATVATGAGTQATNTQAQIPPPPDTNALEIQTPGTSDTGAWGAMPNMANGQVNTNGGTGGGRPYIRKPVQPSSSGKRPVATTPGF
jgi:hypothetical protein